MSFCRLLHNYQLLFKCRIFRFEFHLRIMIEESNDYDNCVGFNRLEFLMKMNIYDFHVHN